MCHGGIPAKCNMANILSNAGLPTAAPDPGTPALIRRNDPHNSRFVS